MSKEFLRSFFIMQLASISSLYAATYNVTDAGNGTGAGTLRDAFTQACNNPGPNIVNLTVSPVLSGNPIPIYGSSVIDLIGNGNTISGSNSARPFVIESGRTAALNVSNLTITLGNALGGTGGNSGSSPNYASGGGGGGGGGLGGAFLCDVGPGGATTFTNVSFTSNTAQGGAGGNTGTINVAGGGGGGGLEGNGGSVTYTGNNSSCGGGGGGGSFPSDPGSSNSSGTGGMGGGLFSGKGGDGGSTATCAAGGGATDGNPGSAGARYGGGGGGSGCADGKSPGAGGAGGALGGGGGGAGDVAFPGATDTTQGSLGGFGAGGGGSSYTGTGMFPATAGYSTFGGGNAGAGTAGGGAGGGGGALGGALFISNAGPADGVTLVYTSTSTPFSSNTVTAGLKGTTTGTNTPAAQDGAALGKDIFIMGGAKLTFDIQGATTTTTMSSLIKSNDVTYDASGTPTTASLSNIYKTGTGTLSWVGAVGTDTYTSNLCRSNFFFQQGTFEIDSDLAFGYLNPTSGSLTGSTLEFSGGKVLLSTGTITVARAAALNTSGTLGVNTGATLTWSGILSGMGGSLTKTEGGMLVLSGSNTYTVGTTITAGTVQISSDGNLGNASGTLTFNPTGSDTATLQINAGGLSSNRITTLSGNGGIIDTQTNTYTFNGAISGTALTKSGMSGTLILTNTNTYTTTTISAGTLQVGDGGVIGTLGSGNVTNNGTLSFNRSDAVTVGNVISGSGAVTQDGIGTTILTGTNTYMGSTTISAGTLQVGDGGMTGTLGSGMGAIANDGTLAFNRSNSLTVANVISGSGAVTQDGTGTTILTGANTYMGTTTITAGTLQVGNGGMTGTLGSGMGAIANDGTLSFNRSNSLTVANVISGSGAVTQDGSGTTILTGTNTYMGSTTISAGTLQVGDGGMTGTLGSDTGPIANDGTLAFNRSDAITVANVISGSGAVSQDGSGTTTLTGANSYMGITTISAGTLQVGDGGVIGTLGSGNVTNNGTLAFNRSDAVTVGNVISGSGAVTQDGIGTTILTGTNTYMGSTTISAGTLQVGDGGMTGTLGSGMGAIANDGTLAFNRSNSLTVANVISGSGAVTQDGSGTTILTGTNTYMGSTTITAGTLQVGSGSTTGTLGVGDVTNDGILVFNRSNSLTVANAISGSGAVSQDGSGTTILTGANTYMGATTITAGILVASNADALGTTAAGTTVSLGATLQIAGVAIGAETVTLSGNGVSSTGALQGTGTASLAGAVTFVGTSSIGTPDAMDTLTLSGGIGGGFGFSKFGAGTLISTVMNTYSGSTVIKQGTIKITNDNQLGTVGTLVFDPINSGAASTLMIDSSGVVSTRPGSLFGNGIIDVQTNDYSFNGPIGGSGSLEKRGTGTLTLGGACTYANLQISESQVDVNSTIFTGDVVLAGNTTVRFLQSINSFPGRFFGVSSSTIRVESPATFIYTSASPSIFSGTIVANGNVICSDANTRSMTNAKLEIGPSGSFHIDVPDDYISVFSRIDFTGAGGVYRKTGNGILIIPNTSTLAAASSGGRLEIESGILLLRDFINLTGGSSGGRGNLSIKVLDNGYLKGSGTVGPVENRGKIFPGNSIGTIDIQGTFDTQAPGTIYFQILGGSPTESDLIRATGNVTLGNTTLSILPLPSVYSEGMLFTLVQSTGGTISGMFGDSSIAPINNFINLEYEILYNPTTVQLLIKANQIINPPTGYPYNPQLTIDCLFNTISQGSPLYPVFEAITFLPPDQLGKAMTNLGSSQFGGLPIMRLKLVSAIADGAGRFLDRIFENADPVTCWDKKSFKKCKNPWVEVLGYQFKDLGDSENYFFGYKDQVLGFTAGYDQCVGCSDNFSLGGVAGYYKSDFDWYENFGDGRFQTVSAGLYAQYINDSFYFHTNLIGTINWNDITRKVQFGAGVFEINQNLKNKHSSYDVDLFARIGGTIRKRENSLIIRPQVDLQLYYSYEEGYKEKNVSPMALRVKETNYLFFQSKATLDAIARYKKEKYALSLNPGLGWLQTTQLSGKYIKTKFITPSIPCDLPYKGIRKECVNQAVVFLNLGYENELGANFLLGFEGEYGQNYELGKGTAKIAWNF